MWCVARRRKIADQGINLYWLPMNLVINTALPYSRVRVYRGGGDVDSVDLSPAGCSWYVARMEIRSKLIRVQGRSTKGKHSGNWPWLTGPERVIPRY